MCWICPGFVVVPAWAQTNERAYESLEFRTVTPGARAVGMGKAFVGIADDATAAASNPAGLSNLFDPELSFEVSQVEILRSTRMTQPSPLQTTTFAAAVREPTFASFVTPLPDRRVVRNVTLAVFYNSLQRYEEHFDSPASRPVTSAATAGTSTCALARAMSAAAVLVHRRLSIGGAVTARRVSNVTSSYGYNVTCANFRNGSVTDDSDTRAGGQVGLPALQGTLWRVAWPRPLAWHDVPLDEDVW